MIKNFFFLGSKLYGWKIMKALYLNDKDINWFFFHPDDSKDSRSYMKEIIKMCKKYHIKFFLYLNNDELIKKFEIYKPEIILVHSFYKLIPLEIINKTKIGVFGFHNSLLPKYRGGAPIVWQILNNEDIIGSTLFKINKDIDSGEILFQIKTAFKKKSDVKTISEDLLKKWIKNVPKIWKCFQQKKIKLIKQNEKDATFFPNRKPIDGKIDWSKNSNYIDRFIRAQRHPYPGAFFIIDKRKIYIKKYLLYNKKVKIHYGSIIKEEKRLIISCGNQTGIIIKEIIVNGVCYNLENFLKKIKRKKILFPFYLRNNEHI